MVSELSLVKRIVKYPWCNSELVLYSMNKDMNLALVLYSMNTYLNLEL